MGWDEPIFRGVWFRGEWDGLVPIEEYSSQIRDQSVRPKLADELVPPGTSDGVKPPLCSCALPRETAAGSAVADPLVGRAAAADPAVWRAAAADPAMGKVVATDPETGNSAAGRPCVVELLRPPDHDGGRARPPLHRPLPLPLPRGPRRRRRR
jgi:hypothetical protein